MTDGWTDRRQTMEPAYTISSPGAFGSGELTRTAVKKGSNLIIYMPNDLAHFINTVVNDGTCEDRPHIKF